jgi:hypothetical protein
MTIRNVVIVPKILKIIDLLISKNLAAENFGKFSITLLPNTNRFSLT